MNQESLKIKVILAYSAMATVLGMMFQPEVVRSILPFAICVVFAVFVLYLPDMFRALTGHIKTRRNFTMASKAFRVKGTSEVTVRVTSVPSIDYDNYLIPSYLRRQEVK